MIVQRGKDLDVMEIGVKLKEVRIKRIGHRSIVAEKFRLPHDNF